MHVYTSTQGTQVEDYDFRVSLRYTAKSCIPKKYNQKERKKWGLERQLHTGVCGLRIMTPLRGFVPSHHCPEQGLIIFQILARSCQTGGGTNPALLFCASNLCQTLDVLSTQNTTGMK